MERVRTMRTTLLALATCAALVAAGCHHDTQSASSTSSSSGSIAANDGTTMSPEDLGKLGAQINKNPSDAAKLLAEHGLNNQSFERAIRKVSSNPEESKRYAAAYKRAS